MKWINAENKAGLSQTEFNHRLLLSHGIEIPKNQKDAFIKSDYRVEHLEALAIYCANLKSLHSGSSGVSGVYTYFGQFIDHDISNVSDPEHPSHGFYGSLLEAKNAVQNPLLLSSIYGQHEHVEPESLGINSKGLFALNIESPFQAFSVRDLPRNSDGTPKIADLRNDDHFLIAQIHCLFLRLHNALVRSFGLSFNEAKRQAQSIYRDIVVNDYLNVILYEDVWEIFFGDTELPIAADHALDSLNDYHIPAQFHAAVFRFGHAMVRPKYTINGFRDGQITLDEMFFYTHKHYLKDHQYLPNNLQLSWPKFLKNPDNHALRVTPRVTLDVPGHEELLARRNLLRGRDFALGDAQAYQQIYAKKYPIAKSFFEKFGMQENAICDLPDETQAFPYADIFTQSTPLWYYTLRESYYLGNKASQGYRTHSGQLNPVYLKRGLLGPLASFVIADVFKTLLQAPVLPPKPELRLFKIKDLFDFITKHEEA